VNDVSYPNCFIIQYMVEVLVLLRHYDPCGNFKMFSISLANIKLIPDIRAEY